MLLTAIDPVDAMRFPTGTEDPDKSAMDLVTLNDAVLSVQSMASLGLSSIRSNVASA